jgi:ferric-dicitrate binding protein FerR (iron transport regulator)
MTHPKYIHRRHVKLTGEAYFEVVKGEGFRVKTLNGEISVLGTRFLVNDRGEDLHVQCFQGKVATLFSDKSWILEPGTQFKGDSNSAEKSDYAEDNRYPVMARFMRNFNNAPLSEVISEMETFFNVTINIKPKISKNFSGTIQSGNLESVLQIVCESLQLKYTFEDDYTIKIY